MGTADGIETHGMEENMSQLGLIEPQSKEAMLRDWVRRRLGAVEHEMRVARVARTLFGLTRPWHGLGAVDLWLLGLAAVVHDVGRADGGKRHEERGAAIISETRGLPLDVVERRRLAYLVRYHKGEVPAVWEDGYLDRDEDDGVGLRCVLGMLRAADGLDSRSAAVPSLVIGVRGVGRGSRVVSVNGYVEDVGEAETVFGRRKKFRLLEETLACEVEVGWFGMKKLAAAS
jgi:exopolyphosphatase/pppGpp-phosphohydrolase